MKILLTGKPRSGKTTLLEDFIKHIPEKQGFITREVREGGERVRFELVSSVGSVAILADVKSASGVRVSRYGVELEQLDDFLTRLPSIKPDSLLYVDEIGQMELLSKTFKELIATYLDMDNLYIGTITNVFQDEFTEAVLQRDDVILLTIEQSNREKIWEALEGLAQNIKLIQGLDPEVKKRFIVLARDYANMARFIQLKKLFKNTVRYVVESRVNQINNDTFYVRGDHNEHRVTHLKEQWTCDCDLFNGVGSFKGNAGECSHIQAVRLVFSE